MQVAIYNIDMEKVGDIDLPDDVFGVDVNEALLWEQVKAQLASRRRGTHKTKKRGEVSGGGRKPYKQKGSGNARHGSTRSPIFVGGGTVFGPQPRDYSYRLPKSARQSALRSALSLRAKDGVVVLEQFQIDAPKTKTVVEFLKKAGLDSALFLDVDNTNLQLSVRNVQKTKFLPSHAVNVYDLLAFKKLVVTKSAIEQLLEKVKPGKAAEAA